MYFPQKIHSFHSLKLLIHTACLIERTLINGHELKIISEDDTRPSHETIFHVKKAFKKY